MVSALPARPLSGHEYPNRTDSPAAQEAARQRIALAAATRFIRDLSQLANKPQEQDDSESETPLAAQIREAVTAAGHDYDAEMRALAHNSENPDWIDKAEFYLAKMVRNVPDGLRERACDAIKGDEGDFNATQCVEWARDFFGKAISLTPWADMTALLLDFAFVRQGIDDDYHRHRALETHEEAPKALSSAELTPEEIRQAVQRSGTSEEAVQAVWQIVGRKRELFDDAIKKFLQDHDPTLLQTAAEREIATEIVFEATTATPEGRAQVTTELQQLQNIWDTAPDVSDFFSTIGSQEPTVLDYLVGQPALPNGINLRDNGSGVWQVNVPSVWGDQRWQTVGTKEEAASFGTRVLREHKETNALVASTPSFDESATETLARWSLERFKNATFDEEEPLQCAGEPHSTAIMRVADSAKEVAALMERKTQAGMGTKIKWGGMALCATMLLISGNPVYLAFMGVAYVMGWALIDKAGIERNTRVIDKTLEDKRLKEL